jgi:hypothetical protein
MLRKTPSASATSFGIVKIGTNINVANGAISTSGGSATIGTWTPGITSSLGATITLTTAIANYAKVGQLVTCMFDFVVATETGGGNAGLLTLTGLPFVAITGTGIVGSLIITYFTNLDSTETYITGTVAGGASSALLWQAHQANAFSRLRQEDIQPTTRLVGTITYLSAS